MQITLSAVADYASISEGNKLNVMGVFDAIYTNNFPTRHPYMVFAFRLRADWEDGGQQKNIVVHLEDEDGRKSVKMEGMVRLPPIEPGMFKHENQILALRDVVFRRAGQYRFRIQVEGQEPIDHPLQVILLKKS